jgi:purine-binding chemotaxis protein CheW
MTETAPEGESGGYGGFAERLDDKYFTFWIREQLYAMPVERVVQIVGVQPLTAMPEAADYMKGLMNIRGDVIPAIDLQTWFFGTDTEFRDRTCIIIVNDDESRLGLIVDGVNEVASIRREEFADSEPLMREYMSDFISRISNHNGNTILHIDMEKLCGGLRRGLFRRGERQSG